MMFSEGTSIPTIVRESRKPLTGSLMPAGIREKSTEADKDEYA